MSSNNQPHPTPDPIDSDDSQPDTRTDSSSDLVPYLNPDPHSDSNALPGIQAFHSLGSIAPFMTLWQLYAGYHYPEESDAIGKYHCFTSDHKWVVRLCFAVDFLIRAVLVLLVLVVILRGLSLWPLIPQGENPQN